MSKYGIEHIVVLMLENRSFDHLFGFLDHPQPFDGLTGNEWNPVSDTDTTKVYVTQGAKPYIYPDPSHEHTDVLKQMSFAGQPKFSNRGFYHNFAEKIKNTRKKIWQTAKPKSKPEEILACWDPTDPHIKNLTYLAKKYVLCDNWHCSVPGETWPNRNYIHAGTSGSQVNIKIKFYTDKTIFEALAERNLTWRIYHDFIAQSMAFIKLQTLGNGSFEDYSEFKKDVKNDRLPHYTFIEPRHFKATSGYSNSMHPGNNSTDASTDLKGADNLVGEVYNTLISNPEVWQKTLLVITFDEHGGFYDHKKTRSAYNPGSEIDEKHNFRFNFLGVRVPAILISPKFEEGKIDSTPYDHTSVIKSVFENFDIPGYLTNRDKNANSFWGNIKTSRARAKAAEPIALHRLKKSIDVDNMEELNGFQQDLIYLAESIEKASKVVTRSSANLDAKVADPSFDNRWKETEAKKNKVIDTDRLMALSKVAKGFYGKKK
ncbi:MAG TPA: alkaline phosphatase family protein [Saprospiraceae bacterium]|nr:alkaline phosphatase family protein [Saprospiraceae bacterium]